MFSEEYPFEAYIKEKRETEARLRKAFSTFWKPEDDFEVASDENMAITLCGSIYEPRVLCRDYLSILYGVLQETKMKDEWLYDTAVELSGAAGYPGGQFIVRGSMVSVLLDYLAFDFVKCFSRSRVEAEADGYRILRIA